MTSHSLKLRAKDQEDVEVISAILQDAIVPLCDVAYRPESHDFIMVVHRFCWCDPEKELSPDSAQPSSSSYHRVCCAVHLLNVNAVQVQGVNQEDASQMLDLLAFTCENDVLTFVFAGDARFRVKLAGGLDLRLEDFGEPWPTSHQPVHEDIAP